MSENVMLLVLPVTTNMCMHFLSKLIQQFSDYVSADSIVDK